MGWVVGGGPARAATADVVTESLVCPRCLLPAQDGLLCAACVHVFERSVADLGMLLPELATTVARLDVVHRANTHHYRPPDLELAAAVDVRPGFALAAHPLPINPDAVDLARQARRVLLDTVRAVGWHPLPTFIEGPVCRAGLRCRHWSCQQVRAGVTDVTGSLIRRVGQLRRHPNAADLVDDLEQLARRVESMVDRRPAGVYVGPCDQPDIAARLEDGVVRLEPGWCGVDLYARLGDATVTCEACGAVYDVRHRRAWLRKAAEDVWTYPALIVQAVAALDVDLTLDRLYKWISRDRFDQEFGTTRQRPYPLILAATDEEGRVLLDGEGRRSYRVGDVLARVEAMRAVRRAGMEATA